MASSGREDGELVELSEFDGRDDIVFGIWGDDDGWGALNVSV